MKLFDILASANHNLLRNKARTLLTVIAIFIGATTLSLTNGIGSGIKAYLNKQVGNLGNSNILTVTASNNGAGVGITNTSSGLTKYTPGEKKVSLATAGPNTQAEIVLTQKDINKIKTVPNIISVEPTLTVTPDYIALSSNLSSKYAFTIAQTVGTSDLDMSAGKVISNSDTSPEITIPISYVSSFGFTNNSDALNQKATIGVTNALGKQTTFQATIVGVQQKALVGSTAAYANNALFNELYDVQTTGLPTGTKDAYTSVSAVLANGLSSAQIQTVKNNLSAKGYDGKTAKDQASTIFTAITAITYVLDGFAGITLIAAAFGIVNTLYMSVSERTKEIGLMKALGMSKIKIFTLFSIEATLIGFWGSVLGVGFANLAGRYVNSVTAKGFLKDFPGLNLLSFPLLPSSLIVLAIILIAFIAGTLPARRASKKDPIEALRYE